MHDDSSGHEHLSSRRLFLGGALGAAGLVAAAVGGYLVFAPAKDRAAASVRVVPHAASRSGGLSLVGTW